MLKKVISLFIIVFVFQAEGQKVFPYLNYLQHLKSFQNGMSRQIDNLSPSSYKFSENIIAYEDSRNDLIVYDGEKKEKLSGLANRYQIGLEFVVWNEGPNILVWDQGQRKVLTRFGGRFQASDSLIVFEDLRDNAVRVYYNHRIYDLYHSISRPVFPKDIGPNTVAFEGNGDVYYVFIAGNIQEVGVLHGKVDFATGGNLIAFNDPFHQTFAVAFSKEVLNVEPMVALNYKVGYNTIVYTDQNHNLKGYINGGLVTLSSDANFYKVFRNRIVWGENGTFYTYNNGQRYEIANYIPKEYKLRNEIVAFRNLNGGVSLFYNNHTEVISNQKDVGFAVNGKTVRITISEGNYVFFKEGKRYRP